MKKILIFLLCALMQPSLGLSTEYEFYEADIGKCLALKFNDTTGIVTMQQYNYDSCSAKPTYLIRMARTAARYEVLVQETDGDFIDYSFKSEEVLIRRNSNGAFVEHRLLDHEMRKLVAAIQAGKSFNIGYFDGKAWTGPRFNLPHSIDGITQKAKKIDDHELRTAFNNYSVEERKLLQSTLKALGYYKSVIDGLYGPGTRAAIYSFARDRGQSENTLNVLRGILSSNATLAAIKYSDDLNKFGASMLAGAQNLIDQNKCSLSEIKDYGGWVKSGQRKGQYFMDCGNTRHWLNPTNSSGSVTTARHVSESAARDMCWAYVRREIPGASMQAFNTSFTKHSAGAVTYTAGFKAKNIYGNTIKYYAYCLIQPNRSMEVTFQQR